MPVQKLPRPLTNKIQLSLHIRHPSLQPEEISKEMRWLPVDSFAVGEPCQASIGSGTELAPRLHTESYWVATLDAAFLSRHSVTRSRTASRRSVQISDETLRILASSESTESFITLACSSLLRHASFFESIRNSGGSAKLIVTMVEPTLRIPPEVSRRLADLGITLEAEFVSR
jgi:hypothetical protein